MELLLGVATILGGAAAVWYFHDKLSGYYGLLRRLAFNDGFPRDYDETDKEWCRADQTMWKRIPFKGHYVAWDGPLGFVRRDGETPWTDDHLNALKQWLKFEVEYAMYLRIEELQQDGFRQLYETDCRTWRRELIDRNQFIIMLRAKGDVRGLFHRLLRTLSFK